MFLSNQITNIIFNEIKSEIISRYHIDEKLAYEITVDLMEVLSTENGIDQLTLKEVSLNEFFR